jgi:hypothetical protein
MTPTDSPLGSLLSLPPPRIAADRLSGLLSHHWGLTGRLTPLTSERDLNHRLAAAEGRFTVKLSNPAEPAAMTDFQSRAFLQVAARDPGLPVPRLLPPRGAGAGALWLDLPEGRLRVFTWSEGTVLAATPRTPAQARAAGQALARLTLALQGFVHPAADHVILWDIRQVPRLAALLPGLADAALRAEAEAFVLDFEGRLAPVLGRLPVQVCHADFNPHNLLADPADPDRIAGILDFGDMVRTPRICDLAVAASYQIADAARPLDTLVPFLQGYAGRLPLAADEVALLYDLILARIFTTLLITGWRAARYPENAAYILRNVPSARAGLDALQALGRERALQAFSDAACSRAAVQEGPVT